MKIKTKYDIDDRVEFIKKQETSGGKNIDHLPEVGIIEKVLFDGRIFYLMKSSYPSWVSEEEIKHKLEKHGN